MFGLVKAALLFNILVVQGSVFREQKYLQDRNHFERYESTYSDTSSDYFGNAFENDFDNEEKFTPRHQRRFTFRKILPDWFPKPGNTEDIDIESLHPTGPMGPVGPIGPIGPIGPTGSIDHHLIVPGGAVRIGYPMRRIPGSNRRSPGNNGNNRCQNIKGLPTPESGCCGMQERRFPANEEFPSYPGIAFWPDIEDERFRRSADDPPNKMIRGGRATDLHQLPWTVRISISPRLKGLHSPNYCGGTIISSWYVLTAAHCVYNTFKDLSQLEVFLAEYDTDTFPDDCIKREGKKECVKNKVKKVDHVIIHKEYNDTYLQNDVALLRLSSEIPYTEFIRPICLPTVDIEDMQDDKIIIAGWGMNGKTETNVKQAAYVSFVPNDKCKEQYSYKDDSMFCSIGDHGEDICHGDSGGPLMVLSNEKYFLSGVVSGKRGDHECGSTVSSLFNNVFYHKDWIVKHVKEGRNSNDKQTAEGYQKRGIVLGNRKLP